MRQGSVFAVGVGIGLAASILMGARNSSGTMSLVAGNPVAAGQTISPTWANNTLSDIATELTDSLSRSGKGPMLAPLECTDGTVSAPSITFDNDTNTGLYRVAADKPAMAVNGTKMQEWLVDAGTYIYGDNTGTAVTAYGGVAGGRGGYFEGRATGAEGVRGVTTGAGAAGVVGLASGASHNSNDRWGLATTTNGGHILVGSGNPSIDTAFTNTLTPTNFPKAWAYVNGSAGSVLAGFNINGISCSSGITTITLSSAMASTNFGCIGSSSGTNDQSVSCRPASTTTVTVYVTDDSAGAVVSNCALLDNFTVMVLGAQ